MQASDTPVSAVIYDAERLLRVRDRLMEWGYRHDSWQARRGNLVTQVFIKASEIDYWLRELGEIEATEREFDWDYD